VGADDSKGPVAVWFQWQLQQDNDESESETIQNFLTVQCRLEDSEAAMSLSHLRLWIQVYHLDMCKRCPYGQPYGLNAHEYSSLSITQPSSVSVHLA